MKLVIQIAAAIVLAIFGLGLIIGLAGDDDEMSGFAPQPTTDASDSSVTRVTGNAGVDDGIRFRVVASDRTRSVAQADLPDAIAGRGRVFHLVFIAARNMSSGPVDLGCGGPAFSVAFDAKGNSYTADEEAFNWSGSSGNTAACTKKLQPQATMEYALAFEIPRNASLRELHVWNNQAPDDLEGEQSSLAFDL